MTNEREEIQNALYLLRSTCLAHQCVDCPLTVDGIHCAVQEGPPCNYKVNIHTVPIWRAFTDKEYGEGEDDDIAACNRESAGDNYW
jgi:hypothetical protein